MTSYDLQKNVTVKSRDSSNEEQISLSNTQKTLQLRDNNITLGPKTSYPITNRESNALSPFN